MNRDQFGKDSDVLAFIGWLAPRLNTVPVTLAIPHHPRFVPGGVNTAAIGLEAVTAAYKWRATGMKSGDWEATTKHCSALAHAIRSAVAQGDVPATLEAAWRIIQWGGGNQTKGAYPVLAQLGNDLVGYLVRTEQAFRLATADTDTIAPPVTAMNSMLTKVHAFLAVDGLPIYDSRVAVAIATLVEMWRRATLESDALGTTPIPAALHFPTVNARDPERARVGRLFPDAATPSHLFGYNAATARVWSGAKLRLGWLMEALLRRQPTLYATAGSLPDRMRCLEAAFFMIGYDVRCLKPAHVAVQSTEVLTA